MLGVFIGSPSAQRNGPNEFCPELLADPGLACWSAVESAELARI